MLDPILVHTLKTEIHGFKGDESLADCVIDREKAHAILIRLAEQKGPAEASRLMDKLKDALIQAQGEQAAAVQVIRIKRPKARITVETFSDVKTLGFMEERFLQEIKGLKNDPLRIVGLLVFSAINYGGLLKPDGVSLLLNQLIDKQIKSVNQEIWFNLPYRGYPSPERWQPDNLTTLLIDRFYANSGKGALKEWIAKHGAKKWLLLLKPLGLSMLARTKLLGAAGAKSSLYISPALIDASNGVHDSRPLSEECFVRGLTKKAPVLDAALPSTSTNRSKYSAHRKQDGLAGKSDKEVMKAFSEVLRAAKPKGKGSLQKPRRELDELIGLYEADCTHITVLLCKWVASRISSKNRWGNRFKASTAYQRLQSLSKRLRSQLGSEDPTKLDPLKLLEVYEEVVDEANTTNLSNTLRKNLRDFHEYLEDEHGVESLDGDAPWANLGSQHAEVDANILWPHEYTVASNYYQNKLTHLEGNERALYEARYIALILGYRCGLRRREVLYLRLSDMHLLGAHPEILVRPHYERALKSNSGNRRIPISVLLTPQELAVLNSCAKRLEDKEYLFSPPTGKVSLINHKLIFDHITWLLQHVTGSPRARFHQLRHSFATLNFYRWMQPEGTPIDATNPYYDPSINVGAQRKLILGLGHAEQPSRKTLHALSLIIGHSGPSLTLEHYIHSTQPVRLIQQYSKQPNLSNELLQCLTGISSRQLQKLAPDGNLKIAAVHRAKKRLAKLAVIPATQDWVTPSFDLIGEMGRETNALKVDLFDYWEALLTIDALNYTTNEASDRFGLDSDVLSAIVDKARAITEARYETGAKKLRHRTDFGKKGAGENQRIFFSFPKKHRDMACVEMMLEHYHRLSDTDKAVVNRGVEYFLLHGNTRNSAIPFKTAKDLQKFLPLYGLLGFEPFDNGSHKVALYAAVLTATDASSERRVFESKHWKFWNSVIPAECRLRYEKTKKSLAAPHGELALRLLSKKPKEELGKFKNWNIKRPASWGFRLGLYLLALQITLDVHGAQA
jgi:integrase